VRRATATATVLASNEHVVHRPQAAGPCMVTGCTGQLEVRHDRMYGKVYTACPACEQRVLEVRQLRDLIDRLKQELVNRLGAPGKYPCGKCGKAIYGRGLRARVCIPCNDEKQAAYMREYWKRPEAAEALMKRRRKEAPNDSQSAQSGGAS
jgi:hypothetical protein